MGENQASFSSGFPAGVEQVFKNEVIEVLREPVLNILEKLIEEKIKAVNFKAFTAERRTVLIGIMADEVLANFSRVEDVDGQKWTGESQDEEVEESGRETGEEDGATDDESGNVDEQDSGLFLL